MKKKRPPSRALFAPGELTCSPPALAALQQNGVAAGLRLLCRHISGDWGAVSDEQRAINQRVIEAPSDLADIVSCYRLAGGIEIVVVTRYMATPTLRWTDICLVGEMIEDDEPTPLDETALLVIEEMENLDLAMKGTL